MEKHIVTPPLPLHTGSPALLPLHTGSPEPLPLHTGSPEPLPLHTGSPVPLPLQTRSPTLFSSHTGSPAPLPLHIASHCTVTATQLRRSPLKYYYRMAQPTQWAPVVSGLYGAVNWSVSPLPSLSSLNQEEAPFILMVSLPRTI